MRASPGFEGPAAAKSGAVVQGFRLGEVLGEGAGGTVYAATRVAGGQAGEDLALKLLHPHLQGETPVGRRFRREAALLRQLRGPHFVPLFEYGQTPDGRLYMVLERVRGVPLAELFAQRTLSVDEGVELLEQVCAALEAAHGAGIIHRDLKPSNVMVEQDASGKRRVRVLDFGLAKALGGDARGAHTTITELNSVFGTPAYMAPEQARGQPVDERADLYAVGVMLYEHLTGRVPFRGDTPLAVLTAHLTEPPPPPRALDPRLAALPALEAIALHALAKAPQDRYASAAAFGRALRLARQHPDRAADVLPSATQARPAHAPEDAPPKLRPAWVIAGVFATALGLAIGVILSLLGA